VSVEGSSDAVVPRQTYATHAANRYQGCAMTTIPQETFASLLRTFRQERKQTQSSLADTAGYDRSYISYLERGLRNPTRDVVLKIAGVLGLSPSDRDTLLLSARFAAEDERSGGSIDLNDRIIELVARSINDLPEPRRNQFRDELAGFLRYLRSRYHLATDQELQEPDNHAQVNLIR
jgi:transcriptional regulator with XRE-family HTH domain